jgi:hypothetical protein
MIAKGTKVMSATSLVIHMEEKKHSITSTKLKVRTPTTFLSSFSDKVRKIPVSLKPATTAIRQNSSARTRKSRYSIYSILGGTTNIVRSAAAPEIHRTVSFFKK